MKTICAIVLVLLLYGCGSGDQQVPLDPVAEPRKSAT